MLAPLHRLVVSLLAAALVLSGCGGDDGARAERTTAEPSASSSSTSVSPSSTPSRPESAPMPSPGAGARPGWTVQHVVLPGGRSFYAGIPTCTGSAGCDAWLHYPRKLIIWAHGFQAPETPQGAKGVIGGIFAATGGDAIPVFAVSAGGTKGFDADICCTFRPVDELGYLDAVIARTAELTSVDTSRVGMAGESNGGILATKAICTQPQTFRAIAVWGASWSGPCDKAPVTIGHWHGSADATVPIDGGVTVIAGHEVHFPPADALRGRLAPGSDFQLTTVPGAPHVPVPLQVVGTMLAWLDQRL